MIQNINMSLDQYVGMNNCKIEEESSATLILGRSIVIRYYKYQIYQNGFSFYQQVKQYSLVAVP